MHSSFSVHHPPVEATQHTSTVTTSTVVSRPVRVVSVPSLSSTTFFSSLSRASALDQTLLYAGVLTFTSATAYAAYSYWQRTSRTAATASKAATVKPAAATAKKPSQPAAPPTEYAAATAKEQLTKSVDTTQQANTTPAATPANLPTPLRTRLSTASGVLFDLDGTLVESAEIWYRLIDGASRHFGYSSVSRDEWQLTFGQSMERNVEMWMVGLDQHDFNRYCDEHYADHLEHLHILDGSIDLLQLVNRKYGKEHTAIITNWYATAKTLTTIALSPSAVSLVPPSSASTLLSHAN